MTSMNPYLNFAGNCREALDFYKQIFNGEISGLQTYGEGMGGNTNTPDRIMHSEFKADGIFFMASDAPDNSQVQPNNNISLSLQFSQEPEIDRVFNALAEGGTLSMPLNLAPWGAKFGMLTDKFGIQWLMNYYVKQ